MKLTKTILTLLAASCLTTVIVPATVWAQDSDDAAVLEKRSLDESEATEAAPLSEGDAAKSEEEGTEHHDTEDHSGHDHAQRARTGPELTVDNVPFALTEAPDDHVLGDDKAPITMIVYASVTCSHCSDWFTNQWPTVKKDLIDSGKIRFVFRELPTAPQQMSMVGFMMAECAPSEDYFEVVQYQMENQLMMFKQAELGKVREEYDKVGKLAGLEDEVAIQACFQDLERLSHIHVNGERATAAKVQGVPAFYINGETYKGGQSADELIAIVSKMSEKGMSKLPTTLP